MKENNIDKRIFWYSLYIQDGFWIFFFVWDMIRLSFVWGAVCFILLTISLTNTFGYHKCSKYQESIIKNIAIKFLKK